MQAAICDAFSIAIGRDWPNLSQILDCAVRKISTLHDLGCWNDVAFDGPAEPNLTREDDVSLSFCGLFWTLGGHAPWKVPVRVAFERHGRTINYWFWVGSDDERWGKLSESKQWERMYLVCREESPLDWEWSEHAAGSVELVASAV